MAMLMQGGKKAPDEGTVGPGAGQRWGHVPGAFLPPTHMPYLVINETANKLKSALREVFQSINVECATAALPLALGAVARRRPASHLRQSQGCHGAGHARGTRCLP